MTRPSVKWSGNIALALTISVALRFTAGAGPAETAGNSSGNQALGVYGSAAGIRNNAYTPITSNATPMQTLDGTKTFSGQIQCPSSKEFLTVLFTPTGGGDANVIVGEDLDLDGTVEYSYSAPVIISGVCANGVISCNAGTWNNCRGFKWTADATGHVSLAAVSINALGGCYCINNSCGNNLLLTRTGQILNSVGGGVTGAIQGVSPKYTITETAISGTSISYHGQDTAGCSALAAPGNLPTAYYSNSNGNMPGLLLAGDGASEAQSQSTLPGSYYNLLKSAYAQSSSLSQSVSCTIGRIMSFSTMQNYCYQPAFAGEAHEILTHSYYRTYVGTYRSTNDCYCANTGLGCPPFTATLVPTVPDGSQFVSEGTDNFRDRNQKDGWDDCTFDLYRYYDYCLRNADVMNEQINDNCSALDANPDCQIQSETVDGVATIMNFTPTGITPLPSCRTIPGGTSTYLECRNWWEKSRKYVCNSGQAWDFSDAKKRADNVVGTTTDDTFTMNYQDMRKDSSGNWIQQNDTATLGTRTDYSAPILACKTRKPSRKTDAVSTGNAAQYLSNPDTWDFFYKRCDENGVCPVDAAAGEQIVINCQVINEFAEAATVMNVLEGANQDMICSSGVRQ